MTREVIWRRVVKNEYVILMDYDTGKYVVTFNSADHSEYDSIWEAKKSIEKLVEKE